MLKSNPLFPVEEISNSLAGAVIAASNLKTVPSVLIDFDARLEAAGSALDAHRQILAKLHDGRRIALETAAYLSTLFKANVSDLSDLAKQGTDHADLVRKEIFAAANPKAFVVEALGDLDETVDETRDRLDVNAAIIRQGDVDMETAFGAIASASAEIGMVREQKRLEIVRLDKEIAAGGNTLADLERKARKLAKLKKKYKKQSSWIPKFLRKLTAIGQQLDAVRKQLKRARSARARVQARMNAAKAEVATLSAALVLLKELQTDLKPVLALVDGMEVEATRFNDATIVLQSTMESLEQRVIDTFDQASDPGSSAERTVAYFDEVRRSWQEVSLACARALKAL